MHQIQNGAELQEFDWSHRGEVRDVAVSPDGRYVALGGKAKQGGGLVLVYFANNEGIVMTVSRAAEVRAVCFARLNQRVSRVQLLGTAC